MKCFFKRESEILDNVKNALTKNFTIYEKDTST